MQERTFILQSQHESMYRAFVIWRSKTGVTIPCDLARVHTVDCESIVPSRRPLPCLVCQDQVLEGMAGRHAPCLASQAGARDG